MITRRHFLAASSGSLVSVGLPFTAMAKSSAYAEAVGIDPKLKAGCSVYSNGQFVARLNLVGLDTPFSRESRLAQYILNFESVEPVDLPEASYEISHPILGRLDLFLQPCGMPVREQHNGIQYRVCMTMLR